jgi:hypothetical protein
LKLGDQVVRVSGDGEVEVVDTPAHIARGERRLGIGVVGEVHFQLAGGVQGQGCRAAPAGEGVARAVEVQQQGARELFAGADAGGVEFLFAVGGELKGNHGAANGGEHVAGVPVAVFMEAGHI